MWAPQPRTILERLVDSVSAYLVAFYAFAIANGEEPIPIVGSNHDQKHWTTEYSDKLLRATGQLPAEEKDAIVPDDDVLGVCDKAILRAGQDLNSRLRIEKERIDFFAAHKNSLTVREARESRRYFQQLMQFQLDHGRMLVLYGEAEMQRLALN